MRTHLVVAVLALLAAAPALAGSSNEAERTRLQQEIEKLAQRSAWTGVERTYLALVALGLPLTPNDHLLAAQAATGRGDTLAAMDRLALAVAAGGPGDRAEGATSAEDASWRSARETLDALQQRFGRVRITVVAPRLAALVRYDMPFAAQEREAIETARQRLIATSTYEGLLPVGKYMVDGLVFVVEPGAEVLDVKVTP